VSGALLHLAFAAAVALAGAAAAAPAAPVELPAYGADPKQTTVSGLSSGGFMAVQLQVAYSASIVGAGIVAGGPYYCAEASLGGFAAICMGQMPFLPPNASRSSGSAEAATIAHKIDSLANLKKRRVYVFSGSADTVVLKSAADATVAFFQRFGVTGNRLQYDHELPAGHALIVPGFGNECGANEAPYISHCKKPDGNEYDQVYEILQHLYDKTKLKDKVAVPGRKVVAFDQRPFGSAIAQMADTGFVYMPQSCEAVAAHCKVHVALHGCVQSAESVGNQFTNDTGYNRWADSNKLIVLYPQVDKSVLLPNPQGCWDWWGYTGPDYAYRSGLQMKAIMAMVKRLAQKP
jgi:poly(3-hydroxybutyrate) depolymerase